MPHTIQERTFLSLLVVPKACLNMWRLQDGWVTDLPEVLGAYGTKRGIVVAGKYYEEGREGE